MATATKTTKNYSDMDWSDLREVCADREVPTGRKKRSWVEKQLRDQDSFRNDRSSKVKSKLRIKGPRTPKREIATVRVAGRAGASESGFSYVMYTPSCLNLLDADNNVIAKFYRQGNVLSDRPTLLDYEGHIKVCVEALNEAAS